MTTIHLRAKVIHMALIGIVLFSVLTPTAALANPSIVQSNLVDAPAGSGQGGTKSSPEFGILGSIFPKKTALLLQSGDGWLVCDSVRRQTSNAIAGFCDPAYSEGTYIRGVITDHTSAGRYMAFHNTATIPSDTINFRFVVNGVVYSSYPQNSAYGRYMLTSSHSTGNMDDRWNLFGQGAAITYDVDRDYLDHTIAGQFLQNFDLAFQIDITYPANSTIYGYFEAWVCDYPDIINPVNECSGTILSPIAQAVEDVVDEQKYCGNKFDHLIVLPPGEDAFERFRDLAETAEYEVDFVTMGWDQDRNGSITDSPGDYFIDGIKALYDRVKANPGNHLVRVRILLGLKLYIKSPQEQHLIVLESVS